MGRGSGQAGYLYLLPEPRVIRVEAWGRGCIAPAAEFPDGGLSRENLMDINDQRRPQNFLS